VRWSGHLARMGAMRNAYKISAVKSETRPLGRPKRRREDIPKQIWENKPVRCGWDSSGSGGMTRL
jgi:hypothetical protein